MDGEKKSVMGFWSLPAAVGLLTFLFSLSSVWAVPTEPEKVFAVGAWYALGSIETDETFVSDATVKERVTYTSVQWGVETLQVAWWHKNSLLAIGQVTKGGTVRIARPESKAHGALLEKMLAFPTSPAWLSGKYLENEVVADDLLQGNPVLFTAVVGSIGRGAFSRPYVFFPLQAGGDSGLTCSFDRRNTEVRKIKNGSLVLVRGVVKEFLMQDVLLENCEILAVQP